MSHEVPREISNLAVGQQSQAAQLTAAQQASVQFLQQQQRHTASPGTGSITSVSSAQTESRPQERVAGGYTQPPYQSVPAPAVTQNTTDFNAYYQQAVYQNLMYPQLAAQAQAFTSLQGGGTTTIRPSGIGKSH